MSHSGALRRKTSKRVKRNRFIAGLFLLLLIFVGVIRLLSPAGGVSLPSVVGMNLKEATSTLSGVGLKTLVALREFDSSVPKGKVISSAPGGGARLKVGGTVGLTISEGSQVISIPTPTVTPSPTGSKAMVTISSYVGLTSDQAQSELTAAGLSVNQVFAYSESVSTGNVISQAPDGTSSVPARSSVTIVVSQGSQMVFIPNVYSLSRNSATTALENLQLKVIVRKIGNGAHVTNISPKVGSSVKRGSTVVITLG